MRIAAGFVGGALALAAVLIPVAPATSAHAVIVPVANSASLVAAFAGASGTDTVVELGGSITVTPGDGSVSVPNGATVTLDMNGYTLSIAGADDKAALSVNAGSTLRIIDSDDAGTSTLNVLGGASGAGIGGDDEQSSGTIIFDGVAQVAAQGGSNGAGIGGGFWGSNGEVEIFGGNITASGGDGYAAGIGGGVHGDAGTITIHDGIIKAEGAHDSHGFGTGAGIGGAGNAKSGLISILGGDVTAIGHGTAAGIGGGGPSGGSNEGNILISGATVTAVGGEDGGSGIGSGFGRGHGPVTITDATVTATGGGCSHPGPAIGQSGGAYLDDRMAITIHNSTMIADAPCATSTQWAAAIGGGAGARGADVVISGTSDVTVSAPGSASAIGGGSDAGQYFGTLEVGTDADLRIDPGSALVVPEDATITNAGALRLHGILTNYGIVDNSGIINAFEGIVNAGIIRGTGSIDNVEQVTQHNFVNTFEANDGSGTTLSTVRVLAPSFADALLELPAPTERAGFNFVGWNAEPDGSGATLEAGTTLGTSAATLNWFAQWEAQAGTGGGSDPTPGTEDPDQDPTPAKPTPGATQGDGLANTGQESPAMLIAGTAALLALGAALVVAARARRLRRETRA